MFISRQLNARALNGRRGFSAGSAIVFGGVRSNTFPPSRRNMGGASGSCGFHSKSLYNLGGTKRISQSVIPGGLRCGNGFGSNPTMSHVSPL
uniref:Keratin type II head domain-containing protein n=1 Tax=Salvator merianae TaxID=96440 RepID=A0A8D0BZL8_SALMN